MMRRIFGPKRDEVTGGWRKLHNEELHNLYSSPSIIRIDPLRIILHLVKSEINNGKPKHCMSATSMFNATALSL
jgi:hypothetical protein